MPPCTIRTFACGYCCRPHRRSSLTRPSDACAAVHHDLAAPSPVPGQCVAHAAYGVALLWRSMVRPRVVVVVRELHRSLPAFDRAPDLKHTDCQLVLSGLGHLHSLDLQRTLTRSAHKLMKSPLPAHQDLENNR